ncbi:energy transducer TonB [Prolixibacter sp. NT017]|uniref:energy transducer TonB n=1 Tax=Prolixibacter sp. NT017 TaxID=2652390 RepID=UPI00129909BC|nr:energy transducer TonB [Prolixibacter sp. NT017]
MIRHLMLGLSLLISVQSGAQTGSPARHSGSLPNLNERFKGGENQLRLYLGETTTYPAEAVVRGRMGLSIAAVTVTPNGRVAAITIVNSLGDPIDNEVTRVLRGTDGRWHKMQPNYDTETFYIQLRFQLAHHPFYSPDISGPNIMAPLSITASGAPETSTHHILPDGKLAHRMQVAMGASDYALALNLLDEAIRRNPYNLDAYPMRITCSRHLYQRSQAMKDVRKLKRFMNQEPLASFTSDKDTQSSAR